MGFQGFATSMLVCPRVTTILSDHPWSKWSKQRGLPPANGSSKESSQDVAGDRPGDLLAIVYREWRIT